MQGNINQFLSSEAFGVIGVSNNRQKFGNKVLRCYLQNHRTAYPIHPTEEIIEGVACLKNILELPPTVKSLSIITPPPITEKIIEHAIEKGLENIWMQPGAESAAAIQRCQKNNINVIYGGPCILVELGFID
jgi:predicted CoA-binding protein